MPGLDEVFFALADPTRRDVLAVLSRERTVTASGVATGLPVTRQAVAKHLAALAAAGLVRRDRHGRETRYSLTPAPLADAMSWMAHVGAQWDARLAALERGLAARGPRPG